MTVYSKLECEGCSGDYHTECAGGSCQCKTCHEFDDTNDSLETIRGLEVN